MIVMVKTRMVKAITKVLSRRMVWWTVCELLKTCLKRFLFHLMKSVSSLVSAVITKGAFCFPPWGLLALNPCSVPGSASERKQLRTLKPRSSLKEGNTTLMETSPLSRPAGLLMRAGGVNWSRTHVISRVSITLSQPPSNLLPSALLKGGTVAFVWLTCLTKVTAAHGCMWMSGPAPLPLCTSVRAGAGRAR